MQKNPQNQNIKSVKNPQNQNIKSVKKTSKSRASGESRVTSQVEPMPGPSTQNDPPAELLDSDND